MGYSYDSGSGRLKPTETEAATVRLGFETYATIGRIHAVKQLLNERAMRDRQGRPWTVPAVRNILSRRLYTGVLACGGVEVDEPGVAIVPADLFARCLAGLEAERARNGDPGLTSSVSNVHVNKEGIPPCPRCDSRQAVRRKRVRVLANGTTRRWGSVAELENLGTKYVKKRWVEAGKFITAAGVSAGIDMALARQQFCESRGAFPRSKCRIGCGTAFVQEVGLAWRS